MQSAPTQLFVVSLCSLWLKFHFYISSTIDFSVFIFERIFFRALQKDAIRVPKIRD